MLWVIGMIGAIFLITWFPRRTKWENCENLKENAKIISVYSEKEGIGGARRIRTFVVFDDGFVYSSCKTYSSLTTQFVNNKIREITAKDAIKKHKRLITNKKFNTQSSVSNNIIKSDIVHKNDCDELCAVCGAMLKNDQTQCHICGHKIENPEN